jgi:hypothetical protein
MNVLKLRPDGAWVLSLVIKLTGLLVILALSVSVEDHTVVGHSMVGTL